MEDQINLTQSVVADDGILRGGSINNETALKVSCFESAPSIHGTDIALGIVFLIIILMSLLGNLLVFVSVIRTYKLRQQIANYFVISLAVADFLVAVVAMFFNGITIVFSGHWLFGPFICDLYNAMDVVFCTASILNLLFISLYRYYQIIKEPLSYGETFSKGRVLLIIAFIWAISFVIAFVPIFTRIYTTQKYLEEQALGLLDCQCNFIVNVSYCIISSSISFWIPSAGIWYFYYHIYRLAAKTAKEDAQRKQSNCTTQSMLTNNASSFSDQKQTLKGMPPSITISSPKKEEILVENNNSTSLNVSKQMRSRSFAFPGPSRLPLILPPSLSSSGPTPHPSISETMHETLKTHIKAAKTLLIILLTFYVCWAPFFFTYVLTHIFELGASEDWVSFVFWLGYFNSLLNPFIYAWKFKDFQYAFADTLGCIFLQYLQL
ncbi:Octbeta [Lepeophtheirus salmonis]|uniref:Octbeta n=1 Tax=Lepeophtheirus salmonis TaxID=72036 RepID=A0A7R8CMY5_LEPSM|nr:Octbeta [Lepeophtheirus salmonis]CAF2869585.1 Octbeta [Lepeophtheirus salmonis]